VWGGSDCWPTSYESSSTAMVGQDAFKFKAHLSSERDSAGKDSFSTLPPPPLNCKESHAALKQSVELQLDAAAERSFTAGISCLCEPSE
jgi:hypothetical protein